MDIHSIYKFARMYKNAVQPPRELYKLVQEELKAQSRKQKVVILKDLLGTTKTLNELEQFLKGASDSQLSEMILQGAGGDIGFWGTIGSAILKELDVEIQKAQGTRKDNLITIAEPIRDFLISNGWADIKKQLQKSIL